MKTAVFNSMLAFSFFFFLLIAKVKSDCPSNSTEWNSNCFSFYSNSTGFADAEITCKQAGGHLALIHDGFTNAVLAQEANKWFHQSTETDFWIGATNLMGLKAWNWTDGSGIDFTDWKKGEPQNNSGSNCASLSISDGFWTSQDCFKSKPFACSLPSTPTYPTNANCTEGWSYFPPTHSCYGVNGGDLVVTWTAAENYCEESDAHLSSIHSYAEFKYLLSYVFEAWRDVWTGINSVDSGVTWKSSDGTASNFLKYASWADGWPSGLSDRLSVGQRLERVEGSNPRACPTQALPIGRQWVHSHELSARVEGSRKGVVHHRVAPARILDPDT